MRIIECPHCHRRVVPADSGACPSCGKNVADQDALNTQMRVLVVRGQMSFPQLCFNCGEPARRWVKIEISNVDAMTSVRRGLVSRIFMFGGLLSAFEAAKHDIFVTLKPPICDSCRKRGIKPETQSYDLEDREMRVVVHRRFRDGVTRGDSA